MPVVKGIMLAATALSGALSASAQIEEGKAAEAQGNYNANVASINATQEKFTSEVNAQTAETNADQALLDANEKKRRIMQRSRLAEAKTQGKLSRRGVSLDSISAKDVLSAEAQRAEGDAVLAGYEGAQKAAQERGRARNFRFGGDAAVRQGVTRADQFRVSGQNAKTSSRMAAGGTVLGTVGSLATTQATFGG